MQNESDLSVKISARIDQTYRAQRWIDEGITVPEVWTWRVPVQELPANLRAYLVKRGFWTNWERDHDRAVYQLGNWHVNTSPVRLEWESYETTPDADPIAELQREQERYEQANAAFREQGATIVAAWLDYGRQCLADLLAGKHTPAVQEVIERYERTRYCASGNVRDWAEALRRQGNEELAQEVSALDAQLCDAVKAWVKQAEERQRREREEREERERAEMQRWAVQYGSDHLKAVLAAGYDGKSLYLHERIAYEYPGFETAPPNLSWERSDTPSPDALAVATEVRGTVVVVDDWRYKPVEAVIVRPSWRPSLTLIRWFDNDNDDDE